MVGLIIAVTGTEATQGLLAKVALGVVWLIVTIGFALVPFHGQRSITQEKEGELERLKPLKEVAATQESQNKRGWIWPILHRLEIVRLGAKLDIRLAFVSALVTALQVRGLTGRIWVRRNSANAVYADSQEITFSSFPGIKPALNRSNSYTQSVDFSPTLSQVISGVLADREPIFLKLELELTTEQGQLQFNPNDDEPLHLSTVLYPLNWRSM